MAEQNRAGHNLGQPPHGPDVFRHLLDPEAADVVSTNGRYNLALDAQSLDVTRLENRVPAARFLIIDHAKVDVGLEDRLIRAGIDILDAAVGLDHKVFYPIEIGAKPLSNERFFPDRESTATYVSDIELWQVLGKLWKDVYKATGQLPLDRPLRHTGMLEFSDHRTRLFPIPPYEWTAINNPGAAKEHFLVSMGEEFLMPATAAADYERLVAAAGQAWEKA